MGGMYRHVVMFRWAEDVDASHVSKTGVALDDLPAKVDTIRSYVHGPNVGVADGNYDYVVVADFDDEAGYVVYRDHPDHVALIAADVAGRVVDRAALQYEIG